MSESSLKKKEQDEIAPSFNFTHGEMLFFAVDKNKIYVNCFKI